MKNALLFDFIVDKDNNTITIKREFDAALSLVWDAWTKPEILDQWWAPKPWISKTKSMDFRTGGHRIYAMCGPEGEVHWAITNFKTVDEPIEFSGMDAFSDEEGNLNKEMPQSYFQASFTALGDKTLVENHTTYPNLAQLEMTIQMGFKEGMTMALENLDQYFEGLKKTKITISAFVNAPIATVWDCWTKPEHITKWNQASDDWHTTKAENDLRVGGSFTSRMEAKDGSFGFDFGGTYNIVELHQRIAYTLEDERKVNITFTDQGTQTIVVETFEAESQHSVELQQQGWQMILDNFRRYCEGIG